MKISIIIPVYNGQKTIREAIESVLNQNFPKKDFEIIVINDGSTDKTINILKEYKDKIRVINQKNQGGVKAANVGFKKAKGEYVIKLDADDSFRPDILKIMSRILDSKKDIDFVYSDYYEKSVQGKIKIISTENNIFQTVAGGILFRKESFAKEGFYNENFWFAEYDLLLKTEKRWKGFYIKEPLFYYNRRNDSMTADKKSLGKAIDQLKEKYPEKKEQISKIREY